MEAIMKHKILTLKRDKPVIDMIEKQTIIAPQYGFPSPFAANLINYIISDVAIALKAHEAGGPFRTM